jgi:phosphoglycerate dehydrogenase-like enzyme
MFVEDNFDGKAGRGPALRGVCYDLWRRRVLGRRSDDVQIMTNIGVFLRHTSLPSDVQRATPQDRVTPINRDGPFDVAAEVEVAFGFSESDRIGELLSHAPRLRWLHTVSVGVGGLPIGEIARQDLLLTNNSGSSDVPIAEHVLAIMLAVAKRLPDHHRAQERHEWQKVFPHTEIRDSTLVVLGLGSIGAELARLASSLGVRVIGVRRRVDAGVVPGVGQVVGPSSLLEVVSVADFIAVTAPLTQATKGLVSAEVIARLKPSAWIINVARGPIIDEMALLEACRENQIGGAAIDTWWTEPLPPDSEWWSLPNVIVTPHASSSSPRGDERSLWLFLENLRRWKGGEKLLNVVDLETGY